MSDDLIVIDAQVLKNIARGSQDVANDILAYKAAGKTVVISQAAFDELVTRAPDSYMRGHYREMLKDLKIEIAPKGALADRVDVYARNITAPQVMKDPVTGKNTTVPKIDEYGNYNQARGPGGVELKPAVKAPGDVFVGAQAKAAGGKVLTYDDKFIRGAERAGIPLADKSRPLRQPGTEDLPAARARLRLPVADINRMTGERMIPRVGVPAMPQRPITFGPSEAGQAKFAAGLILLGLIGNYLKGKVEEKENAKAQAAIEQSAGTIQQALDADPGSGVLVILHFVKTVSRQESVVDTPEIFSFMRWGKGPTRDEARRNASTGLSPAPGDGQAEIRHEVWYKPGDADAAIQSARPPFKVVAYGKFKLDAQRRAKFQAVSFDPTFGFDDEFEQARTIPESIDPRFAILQSPLEIIWYNLSGRQTTMIPTLRANTSDGAEVTVVDLDPVVRLGAKALPIFPIDKDCETVFSTVESTRVSGNWLGAYVNMPSVRWIRPENIQITRLA